jgi:hypothetical protein
MGNKEEHILIFFSILNRNSVCMISFKDEHFKLKFLFPWKRKFGSEFSIQPYKTHHLYIIIIVNFLKIILDNSTQLGQYFSARPIFFNH